MRLLKNKKILITGAPRSGSEFITKYLWENGIQVGHECTRENGTVSALHAHLYKRYDITLHQIRDPLQSIISLHKVSWKSHESRSEVIHGLRDLKYLEKNVDDVAIRHTTWKKILPQIRNKNRTRQCMQAWLTFNKIAEKVSSWSYKIEDLMKEEIFNEWLERLGIDYGTREYEKFLLFQPIEKQVNTDISEGYAVPPPPLTWDILERLDAPLTNEVKEYGKKFGYNIT